MLKCREIAETGLPEGLPRGQRWRIALHQMMCRHCRRFLKHLRLTREVAARVGGEQLRADAPAEAVFRQLQAGRDPESPDGRPE
jgi:hypothetical protein